VKPVDRQLTSSDFGGIVAFFSATMLTKSFFFNLPVFKRSQKKLKDRLRRERWADKTARGRGVCGQKLCFV